MFIARWIQTKEEKKTKEIQILSDTLKYLFKTKQTFNSLLTDKSLLDKTLKEFPQKSSKVEKMMYENLYKDIKKDFFPEVMFQSFQLKRLKDKSFYTEFEIIMKNFELLGDKIMEEANDDVIFEINTETLNLMKSFIEKCNAKAKL